MRKLQVLVTLAAASLLLVILSCSRPVEEKIVGKWKVEDIKTDADTGQVRPEVIEGAFRQYRSVYFEFFEDGKMNIISNDIPYGGTWEFNQEEQSVYIMMDGSKMSEPSKLGEYRDNRIVAENKTGIGNITVIYVKE